MTNNTSDAESQLVAANDEIAHTLIPAMAYLVVLMLLGIVGNLLVCFVFFFRLRMSTQDYLIIALAVFDLLSCFIAMPTEIVDMRYFLMFDNEFACRLLRFIIHYCAFASILTLVVIAADRYMKVCRPLHRQMSLKHIKVALLAILLVALVLALPATVVYGIRTTEVDGVPIPGHDCSTNDHVKDTAYPLVYNSVLFAAFFLVLGTLAVIYVRIWREMKRHRLYMARNSIVVAGGDSRFYLSSVSEASSAGECPASRRRCSTTPPPPLVESGNDDVFAAECVHGQRGASSGRAAHNESASSDSSADHKLPSARSDTTLCEAELDTVEVHLAEPGHGEETGSVTAAESRSRVLEGAKKPRPQLERNIVQPDVDDDVLCPKRRDSVAANGTLNAAVSLEKMRPVLGEVHKELVTPTPDPVTSNYSSSDGVNVMRDSKDANDSGLKKNRMHDTTDKNSHNCLQESVDDNIYSTTDKNNRNCLEESVDHNSNVTETSSILDAVRQTDITDSTCRNEQACIPRRGRERGEELAECHCDTLADAGENSATDGWSGGQARTSVSENCCRCADRTRVSAATYPQTLPTSENGGARAVPPNHPTDVRTTADILSSEGSRNTTPRRSSETETDWANADTAHKTVATLRRSSKTETLPSPWFETERDRTSVSNALKTVDTTPRRSSKTETDGANENSALKTVATPRRSSNTETDGANVSRSFKTAATPRHSTETETTGASVSHAVQTAAARTAAATTAVAVKRRVTKSASVSEVKSHKATVIATSVTVVFFLSFVPHLSLITVRTLDTQFDRNLHGAGLVLYNIFLRSYFINSVTNPFIYGVLNSRFRAECLRVFRQIGACRKRFV